MKKNRAQALTEYVLILLLVTAVCFIVSSIGKTVTKLYNKLNDVFGDTPAIVENFNNLNKWDIQKGDWSINGGVLQYKSDWGEGQIFLKNSPTGDYSVSVDYNEVKQGWGDGIIFRATRDSRGELKSGYCFQYDPGMGFLDGKPSFIIRKWSNGTESDPVARFFPPDGYDWYGQNHKLQLDVVGDKFNASVDGEQVISYTDTNPYTTGGIGIRSWGDAKGENETYIKVDDLSVKIPK